MLKLFSEDTSPIDDQIDSVLLAMSTISPNSQEYTTLLAHLSKLNEIKTGNSRKPVSSDTIALIAGNLFGIVLVVAIEQRHVLASRGYQMLIRPKS